MRRNRVEQNGTIFPFSRKGSSISAVLYSSNSTTDVDVRHAFLCHLSSAVHFAARWRAYMCTQ